MLPNAESGITRVFIPSRLEDNPALLTSDPGYVNRLKAVGSEQFVRAWLEGDWDIIEGNGTPRLRWVWAESGGPPVSAPVKRGFGSRLIERSARDQLGGEATVDFLPRGVVCTLVCALDDAE